MDRAESCSAVCLFILAMSISSYTPAGPLVPALNTFWKYIHVSSIMSAAAMFMVGAAASVLYLVKIARRAQTPAASAGS